MIFIVRNNLSNDTSNLLNYMRCRKSYPGLSCEQPPPVLDLNFLVRDPDLSGTVSTKAYSPRGDSTPPEKSGRGTSPVAVPTT